MLSGLRTPAARIALALFLACQTQVVSAASPAASEYAVKSALLLKLSRFVYFPETLGEQPHRLCVLGQSPFGNTLERLNLASEPANRLQLEFLATGQQTDQCHFIFISKSERRRLPATLKQLENMPLVTISDIRGFARSGGMVELSLDNTRDSQLNIFINRPAASSQGIEFNAQLLRLATLVNEQPEPEQ